MGSASSKKRTGHSRSHDSKRANGHVRGALDDDNVRVDSVKKFDEQIIERIKRDLSETPELFVLNNILMSVMFFENSQKDIEELSKKRYQRNETSIAPDVLLEKVNKNVRYRAFHGPKKHVSEPLVPRRLYVINDLVKVVNSLEVVAENNEKPAVRLEDATRKGYVKLKEIDSTSVPITEEILLERGDSTTSTSRSSTDDSDTTYAYSTLTEMKTPKPLEIIRGLERNKNTLPITCKTYRKVRKLFSDLDLDEDLEDITEDDLYDTVSYVSSRGFMKYFQNVLFPNNLGTNLGFRQENIDNAKSIPGKIFCLSVEDNTTCEIIPSISLHWPREQTLEFLLKGQKPPEVRKRYIFPTERMIDEIKTLSCVLVPKGYMKKKGEHLDNDIEWEIQFPQAERYLESFMSYAQMKSFLFMLTLYKTYIEPKTFQYGLLIEHIRCYLLWECEFNYSDWPEHRLGTKLLTVIKNFNTHIAKGHLRDYFIKDKNVLENVPKKYLRHAQKVFHEILESPVMSFIKSLKNLRYTTGEAFFKPLDFDKLYDILMKSGIESTNPQIISELSIPPNYKKKRYNDTDLQLKHILEVKRREKVVNQIHEKEKEKENLKEMEERRESVDSIDINWACDKKFDIHKKRALLSFFINNYIDIAKICAQISSHKQTLFYLKQAKYLTKILYDECAALGEEVEEFMQKIQRQEDAINVRASKSNEILVSQEKIVEFAPSAHHSNKSNMDSTNASKPRKSVAFVEVH